MCQPLPLIARSTTRSNTVLLYNGAATPSPSAENNTLCDLQTFLRFTDLAQSGGEAKVMIQGGKCLLNGNVEVRRAKKLFPGDKVSLVGGTPMDVSEQVAAKGYVYKKKVQKVKPAAAMDENGNLEFGGRFRSEEWRKERKQKKAERKASNRTPQ
jgi:ribosome-associated protein